MSLIRKLKKIVKPLSNTPLHPQWLASNSSEHLLSTLKKIKHNDIILDIGCYTKWPKKYIPQSCTYIGLDYFETAQNWYHSTPDTYGDALNLPIKNASIDTILLLDVLEHLSNTGKVLDECNNALKVNGNIIIQVPFLYPLHDEPRDFFRFSKHAFYILAKEHHFEVVYCRAIGQPLETSALLTNLALVKTSINLITTKSPALIFIIFTPIFILINNLLAKLFSLGKNNEQFMPYSYHVILKKVQ